MGIRVGLPHLYSTPTEKGQTPSLSLEQFKNLITPAIHIEYVTEKTDGATFKIGFDFGGFWSQNSGCANQKMRLSQDYVDRYEVRGGDISIARAFGEFHKVLSYNDYLIKYLSDQYINCGDISISGEAFIKELSRPCDNHFDHIKFVHTSYDSRRIGSYGSFVVHSRMENSKLHDLHRLSSLSLSSIIIDNDHIHKYDEFISVEDEIYDFNQLNHNLISSRTTPTNKLTKLEECDKFNFIKKRVHSKVENFLKQQNITNKWGNETEGFVIHPSTYNPQSPRFKMVSEGFKQSKMENKLR